MRTLQYKYIWRVDLAQRVLRDGCLLLDRDHSRPIRFEVRTRQEFWDLEPFLRR